MLDKLERSDLARNVELLLSTTEVDKFTFALQDDEWLQLAKVVAKAAARVSNAAELELDADEAILFGALTDSE
jgi:hypothetical protein